VQDEAAMAPAASSSANRMRCRYCRTVVIEAQKVQPLLSGILRLKKRNTDHYLLSITASVDNLRVTHSNQWWESKLAFASQRANRR
jgi:hypothetical protein